MDSRGSAEEEDNLSVLRGQQSLRLFGNKSMGIYLRQTTIPPTRTTSDVQDQDDEKHSRKMLRVINFVVNSSSSSSSPLALLPLDGLRIRCVVAWVWRPNYSSVCTDAMLLKARKYVGRRTNFVLLRTHLFWVIIYNPLVSSLGNLFAAHMRDSVLGPRPPLLIYSSTCAFALRWVTFSG